MGSIERTRKNTVIVGVDPHPGSHTACAMDTSGRVLGQWRAHNDAEGSAGLLAWANEYGRCRWAVEGPANSYARGLVRALWEAGEEVVAITPAMTAEYRRKRWRGKDDEIDAANAARALLANPELPVYAPPAYQGQLRELTRTYQRVSQQLRAMRMAARSLETDQARTALQPVIASLEQAVRELKGIIRATVTPLAAPLLACQGVGPITSGVVLAETGRVDRFPSRDHFASFAGSAPIPWSSGAYQAVRVNAGGNRRLNWAIHIIVLGRLRIDPRTRAYRDRKLAEGKTQREVIRALKTYVCRELYDVLKTLNPTPMHA